MRTHTNVFIMGAHLRTDLMVDPETKKYVINEKEAEAIRIIFSKIIQGWSYRELAEYLNLLGLANEDRK